jgi:hypothetical protein
VDAFDLNVLAANWEASVPVEAAIGAVIAVPEPASIAVLVCVLPGVLGARRRRDALRLVGYCSRRRCRG